LRGDRCPSICIRDRKGACGKAIWIAQAERRGCWMGPLAPGHALIAVAIEEALEFEAPLAEVPGLARPLMILGVEERLTGMARPLAR
jgi:hypothetical protein